MVPTVEDTRIDIARIEGQVKASSVKRVSEFVDKHPEESVSIIRTWLHESA
jgi:flagellar M-ring protein FliF